MLKKLARNVRRVGFINRFGRSIIKKYGIYTSTLYDKVASYWLVSGQITYTFASSSSIKLFAHADDAFTSKLYYREAWENAVVFWITRMSKKANVLFDVGANVGFYTLVSITAKPDLKVFAFEPNPINYARIKKNLSLNQLGEIHIEEKAVGATQGKVDIYLPNLPYVSDVSSVYKSHSTYFNEFEHKTYEVDMISLDEFCEANSIFPDIIKIDVELYELEVLRGMNNLLQNRIIIFCEIFNDKVKRKINKELDGELPINYTYQVEKLLRQYDYHFYIITDQGILYQETLLSSASSYMYLLLPEKLRQTFYLNEEVDIVLDEIHQ